VTRSDAERADARPHRDVRVDRDECADAGRTHDLERLQLDRRLADEVQRRRPRPEVDLQLGLCHRAAPHRLFRAAAQKVGQQHNRRKAHGRAGTDATADRTYSFSYPLSRLRERARARGRTALLLHNLDVELALPKNLRGRYPDLRRSDEIGSRLDRRGAITAQFDFTCQPWIEDVHIPSVRQNCLYSNVSVWSSENITDCQRVPRVPTADIQPLPISVNRHDLKVDLAHD